MAETIRTPVFRRYELAEKIGSGGMGAVYKARDTHLDRYVALKVLPPGVQEDTDALERFRREARALARLKHSHVAAVYDANVEHGFPYLVMEYVEGETLEQLLHRRRRLPADTVIRLGIELAEALGHIHRHRVIHRDVKTSNIILGPDGGAVLADFGIALVATLPRLSHGGLGTPEYMSPEQAAGHTLDGRSDLYSLGVVLYECLTGAVPFQRDGDGLASLTALMQQIVDTPVPIPALDTIPDWVGAVIQRCLAKDPAERFESGLALAAALRAGPTAPLSLSDIAADAVPYGQSAIHRQHAPEPRPTTPARLSLISHAEPVAAVAFSPDGRSLATAASDRRVRLWNLKTTTLTHAFEAHTDNVLALAFSPDGHCLATGDASGTVDLWDTQSGASHQRLTAHPALAMTVAFSPDGHRLATGGADSTVRLWDPKTGDLQRTLIAHRGYTMAAAFNPDGTRLASSGADGVVQIWNPVTGELVRSLDAHTSWAVSVAFSPCGQLLASGGADGILRIWQVETGRAIQTLNGHPSWIMAVAFSPNGKHVATAGRDPIVRIWDASSGQLIHRLDGHSAAVMTATYGPKGSILASGGKDGTVRLWQLAGSAPRRFARLRRVLLWSAAALITGALFFGNAAPLDLVQRAGWGFSQAKEATSISEDPLRGPAALTAADTGWTLVVASPATQPEAARQAQHLRERGYRAGVLPGRTNGRLRFRVGVGLFTDRAAALAARERLAGLDLPAATWVLQIRRPLSISHSAPSP